MDIWGWLRRWQPDQSNGRAEAALGEVDVLFGPSRRHIREYKEWVAVRSEENHSSGAGPADLDAGRIELRKRVTNGDQPR